METKLQVLAASIYLLAAVLLTSCTTELDKTDRIPTDGTGSANRREILLSFKNKLTVKTTKAETQATTKADAPIATEAENEIVTLDVYVFGAKAEGDAYTFRERFAYRQDGSALPAGAKELNLTPSTDNATTTALLELQKGLFVRLYCIANQTELINPVDGNPVANTYFAPLTYDMETGILNDGTPSEEDFCKFHSPLLTAASEALGLPLPMIGAQTTPIDLTDFGSSARVQVGFKMTRTMARFDVSNKENESKFHLESISMGNGRKGVSFFPVKVYGTSPAADDDLITYPKSIFEGDKANEGLQVSAFYCYPSPSEDKGYLILNGTYRINKTEAKEVSYHIPFVQPTADGGSVKLEINANHRYTIGITKADEYHLDFTLDVDEWDEGGNIDNYDPNAGTDGSITLETPEAFKDKTTYDADTRTVTMTMETGSNFDLTLNNNAPLTVQKTYEGGLNAQQYDWLEVGGPVETTTKAATAGFQYKFSLKADYTKKQYPKAILRFTDTMSGNETVVFIISDFQAPTLSTPASASLNAEADSNIPSITIAGNCVGGSIISGPEWLTFDKTECTADDFSYTVTLDPSKEGFPTTVPTNQTIQIINSMADDKKVPVTVSFSEPAPWLADDITEQDEYNPSYGYRVGTGGKTMTVSFYSMFTAPELSTTYDNSYCSSLNGGDVWLNGSKLEKTEIENNRRKYTYHIVVNESTGTDAEYQLHKATVNIKHKGSSIKSYTIWRGASYYGHPAGGGSPYYTAIKKGSYWWAPVNLGANSIPASGTDTDGIGYLYQWGRRDYTLRGGPVQNGPQSSSTPDNNVFYKGKDWITPEDASLWQNGKNDPCPSGWRVPTENEFKTLGTGEYAGGLLKINADANCPQIILPAGGGRSYVDGLNSYFGGKGRYWSSTPSREVFFNSGTIFFQSSPRGEGFAVRCIRD
ncbi:hypothetical protein ACGE0T_04160 [Parabacteroides sp. APC149_11_2_Y6]